VTGHADLLEIERLFTRGSRPRWRPGWTVGESVGGIVELDSYDWSNGIRYHVFGTRSDTEFKRRSLKNLKVTWRAISARPYVHARHEENLFEIVAPLGLPIPLGDLDLEELEVLEGGGEPRQALAPRASDAQKQGLTLVRFSAQLERILWNRG